MSDQFFWRELGLDPGADRQQIKRAYWQKARKNHPDFFPEERKAVQELKMIALNEAYAYLIGAIRMDRDPSQRKRSARCSEHPDPVGGSTGGDARGSGRGSDEEDSAEVRFDISWSGRGATGLAEPAGDRTDLGFHKDPSYAYYKQGFVHFSRAIHGIEALYQSLAQRRVVHFKPRDDAYQRFTEGLVELRRAHEYFSRVVQEFDRSIWKHDAQLKLRRIERFSGLYRRILGNLTAAR